MGERGLSIRFKLRALTIGSVGCIILTMVFFFLLMQFSSKGLSGALKETVEEDNGLFELIHDVALCQGIIQQINREQDADKIEELVSKYEKSIVTADNSFSNDSAHTSIINAWTQLKKTNQAILDLILKGQQALALQKIAYESNPLFEKFMGEIESYRQETSKAQALRLKKMSEKVSSTLSVLVSIMVIVSVGLLISGLYMSRGITSSIRKTVDMLKVIASGEGDLTKRLEVSSKDEVGELASQFNLFVEKLQELIKDIASTSVTLTSSSDELSNLSGDMTKGAQGLSQNSNSVAAASEEMTANMNSVSSAMKDASSNVSIVASSAEQMSLTINEIASNSERARDISEKAVSQVEGATIKIRELGDAAREIDKVTETISDISDQTNLLALNATIEAARAGEHGKGFAVVANEIKELAKQTSLATFDIKNRASGIQQSTSDTVSSIDQISKVIREIENIVSTIASSIEEQSATTKEIATNAVQASIGLGEVNQNVAQSSYVSAEISKEIANVNITAGNITESSKRVNVNADDLSGLAHKLRDLVDRFKV